MPAPAPPAKKKRKAKKSEKEATSKKKSAATVRRVNPLPPQLEAFRCEHKKRLKFKEAEDPDPKNDAPVRIADSITTGSMAKNNFVEWKLSELKLDQLRRLATNFGCKGQGSASKFNVLKAIALKNDVGIHCDNIDGGPNPHTTPHDQKVNTLLRIVNACFLRENVDRLTSCNDKKKRSEFEATAERNPDTAFWNEVSELVNDAQMNDRLSVLCDCRAVTLEFTAG